jgi:hypothetical protein
MPAAYPWPEAAKLVMNVPEPRSHPMRLIALGVAMVLVVAGCGGGDESVPDPPQGGGPLVVYTKSGGVAGVNEHLEIDDDGAATLTVGYQPDQVQRFELGADQLEQLRGLLEEADFAGVDPGPGIGCADCFQYEIAYAGTTTAFAEIAGIPDSVGRVVTTLGEIVDSHA